MVQSSVKRRHGGRIVWVSEAREVKTAIVAFQKIREGPYSYTILAALTPYLRLSAEEAKEGAVARRRVMIRARRGHIVPGELGYAINLLALTVLPRVGRSMLPMGYAPVVMAYYIGEKKNLVAGSLTYIEEYLNTWMVEPLRPYPVVIIGSNKPIEPARVAEEITRGFRSDLEEVLRRALAVIDSTRGVARRKYIVDLDAKPYITAILSQSFAHKEIVVEFSDGVEIHRVSIPLQRPSWKPDDFPPELIHELETVIIKPFMEARRYAARGIILVGPPGVGKTSLGEAIASSMNARIVKLSPSVYRSMWYGTTERILSTIFERLRGRRDVVVLVDDAEFITGRRIAIHEVSIAEVSILLNALQDPLKPFTILTSNTPELIDPALIRPGRIDAAIVLGYPSRRMREKIIDVVLRRYGLHAPPETREEMLRVTRWFTHAEIDALVRLAASAGDGTITEDSLLWARRKFSINESERRRIQEYMKWYMERLQGLVLSYIPGEEEM